MSGVRLTRFPADPSQLPADVYNNAYSAEGPCALTPPRYGQEYRDAPMRSTNRQLKTETAMAVGPRVPFERESDSRLADLLRSLVHDHGRRPSPIDITFSNRKKRHDDIVSERFASPEVSP